MARTGRPRNPSNLRTIKGGKASRETPPPAPSATELTEPRWADLLPGREQATVRTDASRTWRRIMGELTPLGILSVVDLDLLTEACICAARLRQCERSLSRQGLVVETERGQVLNRHVTAANGYRNSLARYVAELGLSPASRARLVRPKADPSGKAGRLLT